ncbi:hypothetical protein PY650_35290 [Rhizobium calliandrae]|uniref:Uncharacterized protein n=1 Tax=Rhizobium calliandrae TaxID=1312182 RepID=A0ABT7KQ25_9HYPH|nr:hypothetical protein [Rhizobium calliandrae]MDL2410730.1 hypothetical protein [Rhizobium calliandrae]
MKDPERHKFLREQASIYQELIEALQRSHPGLPESNPEGNHPYASQIRQLVSYKQSLKTLVNFIAALEEDE